MGRSFQCPCKALILPELGRRPAPGPGRARCRSFRLLALLSPRGRSLPLTPLPVTHADMAPPPLPAALRRGVGLLPALSLCCLLVSWAGPLGSVEVLGAVIPLLRTGALPGVSSKPGSPLPSGCAAPGSQQQLTRCGAAYGRGLEPSHGSGRYAQVSLWNRATFPGSNFPLVLLTRSQPRAGRGVWSCCLAFPPAFLGLTVQN